MALLSQLALAGCSVIGIRTTEEPPFQIAQRVGPVEIRQYQPRLAAQTEVAGSEREALREGFERLAGYIFGKNRDRAKIAMTAPVTQSRQIAMTAPVAQARAADGRYVVQFFMPAGATMASLPEPLDPAVRLVEVPAQTMAVLRFSGWGGPQAMAQEQQALLADLKETRWQPEGPPLAWFYDPPWTIPFLRRNEAAVPVGKR